MKKIAGVVLFFAVLSAGFSFSDSLRKGQVTKQFFAYSISESLAAHPFQFFSTELPCIPVRIWAEEPPVFHQLAALPLSLIPSGAAIFPLLAYLFLGLGLGLLLLRWREEENLRTSWPLWCSVAVAVSAPVFLRYSFQHLPDLLATAFLVWAAYFFLVDRKKIAFAAAMFAVTTKALTVVPLTFVLLIWAARQPEGRFRRLCGVAGSVFLVSLPFVVWVALLVFYQVPNPFVLGNGLENRHSGSLGLLFQPEYYARFFTWTVVKGAGLPLFFLSMLKSKAKSSTRRLLLDWAWAIIPYWLLIREGNRVHDYYSLPVVVPFVLLGAHRLASLPMKAAASLAALSVILSVAALSRMEATSDDGNRPLFCSVEAQEKTQ